MIAEVSTTDETRAMKFDLSCQPLIRVINYKYSR